MEIVYTLEEMPSKINKSIFLCGPSSRVGQNIESWRKDAIKILQDIGYDGVVFAPENKDGQWNEAFNYEQQVNWEDKYLNLCDCIVFWVPRDLSVDESGKPKLPAFTTNIEFGAWCNSGKVVFGAPEDAPKNDYLKHYAEKYKIPTATNLTETLHNALEILKNGAERTGGERDVPLFIWNQPSFQSWYQSHKRAGNRLDGAQLLYTFRPGYKNVFLWILKVNIWVEAEKRNKNNEIVLARPDISSVLLYHKPADAKSFLDYEVVIIKEFRSPANTSDGFIYELVGGSSPKKESPEKTASEEVHEETGLFLQATRLQFITARQLAGTLSSHKSHLFIAKLSEEEITWFKSQKDIPHGNIEDTERTFIEIYSVKNIINNYNIDWTNIGMILSSLINL